MRITLAMDPDVIEKYLFTEDYPTIRQILDELYSNGNVDILLFSDKGCAYIDEFVVDFSLDGIITYKADSSVIDIADKVDVIADVRKELLERTTSIDITSGYKPLIRWFCKDSALLDDSWCLLNSSGFIDDMANTMNQLEFKNKKIKDLEGNIIDPDYLEIENIYISLFKALKNTPEMTRIGYENFYAENINGEYFFYYEG